MNNAEDWAPSKFELRRGKWRSSRDKQRISVASMMIADLQVAAYVQMLDDYAAGDLLDLACGAVPLYGAYRDKAQTVTCVDWPNSLHNNQYLDIEADLTQPLPMSDEAFDTVLMTDVLEHIPTPERLMREVSRVLRPGGHVLIGVPFMYGIHEAPYDYHRYTEHRLQQLCDNEGLVVRRLTPYGDGLHTMLDQAMKLITHRLPFDWPTRALASLGVRHAPKDGAQAPTGYALVAQKTISS